MDDKAKAVIKYLEDFIKQMKQDKVEVKEVELVPHLHNVISDGIIMYTEQSGIFTIRILYKDKK